MTRADWKGPPPANVRFPLSSVSQVLLRRSREPPADQRLAKIDGKRLDQRSDTVEAGSGALQPCIEVAAAVDFELERVDSAGRPSMALDHVAAREGIVEASPEA